MKTLIRDIDILLDELAEYFSGRGDCDAGIPNEELKMAGEIELLQNRINSFRQIKWGKPISDLKTKFSGSTDYMSGVNDGMYAMMNGLEYKLRSDFEDVPVDII